MGIVYINQVKLTYESCVLCNSTRTAGMEMGHEGWTVGGKSEGGGRQQSFTQAAPNELKFGEGR